MKLTKHNLENVYKTYTQKSFVHTDPIEFLYKCDEDDREIVGLIAASLALGRVSQILKSVQNVIDRLFPFKETISGASLVELKRIMRGFKHRFITGDETAGLVYGIARVREHAGSLGSYAANSVKLDDNNVLPALIAVSDALSDYSSGLSRALVSDPKKGSACKRLNLYFRWMVRKDNIDPGGWSEISPSKLIIPLDTHMHKFGLLHGLTSRKAGDMKTALEITNGFKKFAPNDPVKYDFALTRLGILSIKEP